MKVLLVQIYLGRSEPAGPVFPLGLCYVGTALADAGHEVQLLDMNACTNPHEELRAQLARQHPSVVGLSLRNIDTTDRLDPFYYYAELGPTVQTVRLAAPHSVIVVGGPGYSMFARTIMERHSGINFGVAFEGEETAPELLAHLDAPEAVPGLYYRAGARVCFSGHRVPVNFSRSRPPRRDFVDLKRYGRPRSVGVQAKRGCALKCAYCNYPFLNGSAIRMRPPQDVVEEMVVLSRDHGVQEVIFTDSVFNDPSSHFEGICEELLRRRLRMRWSAWFKVDGFSDEVVDLARRAGCYRMCLSPDGCSAASLRALEKGFDEGGVRNVISVARGHPAIDFRLSMLCAAPGEDLVGVVKSAAFFLRAHILTRNVRCLVSWIRLLPATHMQRVAAAEGIPADEANLLPEDARQLPRLFYQCPSSGVISTPLFSIAVRACNAVEAAGRRLRSRWSAAPAVKLPRG